MNTWYKFYALVIAVHVLEVAIVGSMVYIIKLVRPTYGTTDVLVMVAVGVIAGVIYHSSMNQLQRQQRSA